MKSATPKPRCYTESAQTFYRWRSKCDGMEVSDTRRLRELEAENGKLKRLLAEANLETLRSRTCCQKTGEARSAS